MTHPPADTAEEPTTSEAPPKTTLFCPDCGHRSPPDGDWDVVDCVRTRRYLCPDCRSEIAARPNGDASGSGPGAATLWRAWGTGLRAWGRLWCRAVAPVRPDG